MRAAALVLTLCLAALPGAARAQCDAGTDLSVGVVVSRCEGDGLRWAVLTADLAAADVGVRVARPAERGATIDAWAGSVEGAIAAIPGGDFRFVDFEPAGLTIGEGEAWPSTADDATRAVLALDPLGAGLVVPPEQVLPVEPWIRDAVSGASVLRAGVPVECAGEGCQPRPRAGVGLSADGRLLVAVAVEGWSMASAGVTDEELGGLLHDAGAHDAIRVADGATSELWGRDGSIVASSDGAPRTGAAFLAVIDRSMGATGQLVGVIEDVETMDPHPDAHVRVETTEGRLVAEGDPVTSNAYFTFTLPARHYVVRAEKAGYITSCRVCRVQVGVEVWCSMFLTAGDGADACSAPPRGVDAGPWPIGDAGSPTVDAGVEEPPPGGCATVARHRHGGLAALVLMLAALGAARRRRRRDRSGRESTLR